MAHIKLSPTLRKKIYDIKIANNYRNKEWFSTKLDEEFFTDVPNAKCKKQLLELLGTIVPLMDAHYGENWDFHFEPIAGGRHSIWVLIRYPELTIKNSQSTSRTIRNLIVGFKIYRTKNKKQEYVYGFNSLVGTRLTFDHAEWSSGYEHSHLTTINKHAISSSCFMNLRAFCTGSNEIPQIMFDLVDDFSGELFEYLILTINAMMQWESLEGSPHFYIRNVKSIPTSRSSGRGMRYVHPSDFYTYLVDQTENFRENLNIFENLKFVSNSGKYQIKNPKELSKSLVNFITSGPSSRYWSDYYNILLMTKSGDREIGYQIPNSGTTYILPPESVPGATTVFQGQVIDLQILPHPSQIDQPQQEDAPSFRNYYLNLNYLNYVKKKIEEKIYWKTVRQAIIRKFEDSSYNARTVSASSEVPVSTDT